MSKFNNFSKSSLKEDLNAGFSVSLIALPLSLAIASASGFPAISGVISAIVGGIIVSRISGSFVSIYGAAAGLIVVNLSAVQLLGGVEHALGAIFVAGLLIFVFGLLKAGGLSDFFPSSVVQGMLTSIGVIIIIKQLYVAFGMESESTGLIESAIHFPQELQFANKNIVLISSITFLILFFIPRVKNRFFKRIPLPVLVVVVSIILGFYLKIEEEYLIHLPNSISENLIFPTFSKLNSFVFWKVVVTIALITSLESLLSSIAIDSLDPLRRKSNLNKDMSAIGIGSSLASLIGGLPMISEIVRGSANISHGAKSQWANFFHGLFLLFFILVGSTLINLIPISALAVMLLFVGVRLVNVKRIKEIYGLGMVEFISFLVTVIGVLATDLLFGIILGLITEFILHIFKGFRLKDFYKTNYDVLEKDGVIFLKIKSDIVFLNYLSIKKTILKYSKKGTIEIAFSKSAYISYSTHQKFNKLEKENTRVRFLNRQTR